MKNTKKSTCKTKYKRTLTPKQADNESIPITDFEIEILQITKLQDYIKKFNNYEYLSMKKIERNNFFQEFIVLQNNFIITNLQMIINHLNIL